MLLSSLTRKRCAILTKGFVEMPSNMGGIITIPFNDHVREAVPKLVQRLQEAGFKVRPRGYRSSTGLTFFHSAIKENCKFEPCFGRDTSIRRLNSSQLFSARIKAITHSTPRARHGNVFRVSPNPLDLTAPRSGQIQTPDPPSPMPAAPRQLAEEHQLTKRAGEAILGHLVSMITKHLKKGERVRIAGLGILQVRKRAARMGRNPGTGEAIKIKASKKVAFRAAKDLKMAV